MRIVLGQKAKDRISGFRGIVTARAEFLYSIPVYQLTPEKLGADGRPEEYEWFPVDQIEADWSDYAPTGENVTDEKE